jgi:hypothetical protein
MPATRRAVSQRLTESQGIIALGAILAVGALCIGLARSQGYWYLAFVGLIPLFVSIRCLAPLAAAAAGGLWGLGIFATVALLGHIPVAHILTHLAAWTLAPAAYGYVGARLTRQVGFSPYLLALAWMGVELALSSVGMRSGLLAAMPGNCMTIHALASFAGTVVVAFLVVYISALLFTAVRVVLASAAQRRYAAKAGGGPRRLPRGESFGDLFALIRQAHPRAPPLLW